MENQMTWNIESEYPSITSREFQTDYDLIKTKLQSLHQHIKTIPFEQFETDIHGSIDEVVLRIQTAFLDLQEIEVLYSNIWVYVSCTLSIDAKDKIAKKSHSEVQKLKSQIEQIATPLNLFIATCSPQIFESVLKKPLLTQSRFIWEEKRKALPYMLTEQEEILISALSVDGHHGWANLYSSLTGNGKCVIKTGASSQEIGIAQALAMRSDLNEENRKAAFLGIQDFWQQHQESAAAIINGLAGWRLTLTEKRSIKKPMHFLDSSLQENRIVRSTLDAMMQACENNKTYLQKILPSMAKKMGKTKLSPWDLSAPQPVATKELRSFDQAFDLAYNSFSKIDPQMGDFAMLAYKNRWIDSRVLPNKDGGAYCTYFAKAKQPRVFMSYSGSVYDLITLAHELGHAFHSWVMRDLPWAQIRCPRTLAETASVFAETAVRQDLVHSATNPHDRAEFMWNHMQGVVAYLLNIPLRFDFEKEFYERRQKGFVSGSELTTLMDEKWSSWYGNHLTENDPTFWANKMHFSFSKTSFYNFPYCFGYLFSLSIYARREALGENFTKTYIAILQDTGRMTAEDLIMKHLGEDIQQPQFWQSAFDVVRRDVDLFVQGH
jgi:oligoendopeptidase F